jgi:hypothetical protein
MRELLRKWESILKRYLSTIVATQERGPDGEYDWIIPSIPYNKVCMQVCYNDHYHQFAGDFEYGDVDFEHCASDDIL